MRDFSFDIYIKLLKFFKKKNFNILTVCDVLKALPNIPEKVLVLRHDVDKKPKNSLLIALLENTLGISSTYYFRVVNQSFDVSIIKKIAALNHEIGYHYEDLSLTKGNTKEAILKFKQHLHKFRQLYPVETICMHGSPMSKWNNSEIWNTYHYKKYGIIGEPNIEINFSGFFYLTDTGMSWNNSKYAIRDIATNIQTYPIKTTQNIIDLLKNDSLPNKVMINTHPQRWSQSDLEWICEKVTQTLKNQAKRVVKIIR